MIKSVKFCPEGIGNMSGQMSLSWENINSRLNVSSTPLNERSKNSLKDYASMGNWNLDLDRLFGRIWYATFDCEFPCDCNRRQFWYGVKVTRVVWKDKPPPWLPPVVWFLCVIFRYNLAHRSARHCGLRVYIYKNGRLQRALALIQHASSWNNARSHKQFIITMRHDCRKIHLLRKCVESKLRGNINSISLNSLTRSYIWPKCMSWGECRRHVCVSCIFFSFLSIYIWISR